MDYYELVKTDETEHATAVNFFQHLQAFMDPEPEDVTDDQLPAQLLPDLAKQRTLNASEH